MKITNLKLILLRIILLSILFYFLTLTTIYCSSDLEMQIVNHSIENVVNSELSPSGLSPVKDFFEIELSNNVNTSRFSTNTSLLEEVNTQSNNNCIKYSLIGILTISIITASVIIIKHFT